MNVRPPISANLLSTPAIWASESEIKKASQKETSTRRPRTAIGTPTKVFKLFAMPVDAAPEVLSIPSQVPAYRRWSLSSQEVTVLDDAMLYWLARLEEAKEEL